MSRTLTKFGLPFDKATPLVHFPKALKRPRNNAGPASLHELMETVYKTKEQLSSSNLPECMALYSGQPLGLPLNIATEEQPCQDDIIAAHCSRVQITNTAEKRKCISEVNRITHKLGLT